MFVSGRSFLASDSEALEGRARVLEGNAVQPPQGARAVLQAAHDFGAVDGWNGRLVCHISSAKVYPMLSKKYYIQNS